MRFLVFSVALGAMGALVGACAHEARPSASPDVSLDIPRVDGGFVAATEEGGVRFGRENAKVGDRSHQEVTAISHWNDQESSYTSEFVTEVLAVEGPAPSRVKIEFRKNEHFDNVSRQATSIDGHTYIVDLHVPHVIDARTNAPPSDDEVLRVMDVLPDLGTRSQIDQVLPDGTMSIGEHRDDIVRAIARILHPRIWRDARGSAVLERTEGENAVFAIELAATSSATSMKMTLRGDARVRLRDARLEGFSLRGEFERADGDKGHVEIRRRVRDDRGSAE